MSPILLLSIILQVGCAVHVVRTGRPMYWLFILLIGSYIAVLIYLVAVVLPDMQNSRGARRVVRGLKDQIDPGRGRREADAQQTDFAALRTARLLHGCFDRGEHGARFVEEDASGFRQRRSARQTLKQRHAYLFLDRLDLPAQRRLGDV